MVRCGHGAELRRRRFCIGATAIFLLLCGMRGSLHGTLRRLDLAFPPLLPPFVLRAGVEDHGPRERPGECDLTLRGCLGGRRTVLRRLRVGEDADLVPRVVCHGLGNETPAFMIGGG